MTIERDEPTCDTALVSSQEAGVVVRSIEGLQESVAVADLFRDIWRPSDEVPPMTPDVLHALSASGAYVAGAFDGPALVGACIGFFGPPASRTLHSHIAGVLPASRQRHVGFAMKLHQRSFALDHNVSRITWTFDPLIARNAHFNVRRLAARPVRYLVNHYGTMSDALNGDDDSDRFDTHWELTNPQVEVACDLGGPADLPVEWNTSPVLLVDGDGRPLRAPDADGGAPFASVAIPRDIEQLRASDPSAAQEWRIASREAFGELFDGGAHVVDFDRWTCQYVLARGEL